MMKHVYSTSTLVRVSSAFLLAFAVAGFAPVAGAADTKKPAPAVAEKSAMGSIAVVDLQYLVSNSKAGGSIRNQLDKQRDTYRVQIEKQENELRKAEKELAEQQTKLSKDEFMKKGKAFQEKVIGAQRKVQERRVAFDKAYAEAMEKLREHIVKIVADMAGKHNISLVLNRQEVVLVDAKMDLTKDILKALDAKVTSIPVSIK